MNNPEYILVDEMEIVVSAVKAVLNLPVLNYQYGYVIELNETLMQYNNDPNNRDKKFPLVWLAEPFDIPRGEAGFYGRTDELNIFIINGSDKNWKAKQRMENNFKSIIYPIYRELLNQLILSDAFQESDIEKIKHKTTNRYYWGEQQQSVLNDVVDCMKISQLKLTLKNKQNCTILKNF